ncbi:unnamed protein product [Phytomonas sp. Hart1]|nr:unnamed protein product [Phytomonas sp. Hart1]|eukprot:CCW70842.1 unnamed protein product [Phytomonas sp. isolate Hart1]
MQAGGSDTDSLDPNDILQLLFTLSEEDWRSFAAEYLRKLPSCLSSLEPEEQRISIAEVLSRWPQDSPPPQRYPAEVDPREVLSILIALSGAVRPYALGGYLILLFNSYRQVLFANMRRRLKKIAECSLSPQEILRERGSVELSMCPWARDILEGFNKDLLPGVVLRDASPQTVEAGPSVGESMEESAANPIGPLENREFIFRLMVDLVQDLADSSMRREECARGAVAVYGAMWGSMTLCRPLTIGGVAVGERIKDAYRGINNQTASTDALKEVILPSEGFVVSSDARGGLREKIFKLLCGVLEVESPAEAVLLLLSDEVDYLDAEDDGDHYIFNDWEEGSRPPFFKTLTLWQERERTLERLKLWDFSEAPRTPTHGNDNTTLVNLGLFYLLISFMTSGKEVPLLISSSPLSFFFTISRVLSISLKCTSAAALLGVLLFLGESIRGIPKYSIEFLGERRDLAHPMDQMEASSSYRTEQYRIFFEILKQLVSISVMCPNPLHRNLSHFLTLEVLKCMAESARISTHLRMLLLAPFGSVARVLLDSLLKEWDLSPKATHAAISTSLRSDMPRGLVNAMLAFIQNIKTGKSEFIDPLIVALNFFRLFIVRDRSAGKMRLLVYDNRNKLILTEDCVDAKQTKESNSWPWAIRNLEKTILPNSRQCLSRMGRNSAQKRSDHQKIFSSVILSPLEEFALSSAVDGVSALLTGDEKPGAKTIN